MRRREACGLSSWRAARAMMARRWGRAPPCRAGRRRPVRRDAWRSSTAGGGGAGVWAKCAVCRVQQQAVAGNGGGGPPFLRSCVARKCVGCLVLELGLRVLNPSHDPFRQRSPARVQRARCGVCIAACGHSHDRLRALPAAFALLWRCFFPQHCRGPCKPCGPRELLRCPRALRGRTATLSRHATPAPPHSRTLQAMYFAPLQLLGRAPPPPPHNPAHASAPGSSSTSTGPSSSSEPPQPSSWRREEHGRAAEGSQEGRAARGTQSGQRLAAHPRSSVAGLRLAGGRGGAPRCRRTSSPAWPPGWRAAAPPGPRSEGPRAQDVGRAGLSLRLRLPSRARPP
jgi:hypothetical protein